MKVRKPVEVGTRVMSCGSGTSGEVYVNETGDQECFACTIVGARLTVSGSIVYDLGYDDGDEACNVSSEMILVKSRVKAKTKTRAKAKAKPVVKSRVKAKTMTKTKAKDEVEVEESEEESDSDSDWGDEAKDEKEESENSDNDWGEEEDE